MSDDYGLDFETFAATLEDDLIRLMPMLGEVRYWDCSGEFGEMDLWEVCRWFVTEHYSVPDDWEGYPRRADEDASLLRWLLGKILDGDIMATRT